MGNCPQYPLPNFPSMINRLFVYIAALATSSILAYAHLRTYLDHISDGVSPISEKMPQIHGSMVLSPEMMLVFGVVFLLLSILAAYYSLRSDTSKVFFVLIITLVLVWIRLIAGIG